MYLERKELLKLLGNGIRVAGLQSDNHREWPQPHEGPSEVNGELKIYIICFSNSHVLLWCDNTIKIE